MRQVYSNAWRAEEDALLTPHLASGMGAAELAAIAARLNRTWRAVEGRFYMFKKAAGLTKAQRRKAEPAVKTFALPANGGRPFTPGEDRIIIAMRDDRGATFQDIARNLKRDVNVVRLRYTQLVSGEVRPRVIVKRACLCCRVSFEYDRSDGVPLFLCASCRSASVSPYAAGAAGDTGRRAPRLRP